MKKVLLTGASGTVGEYVIKEILKRKDVFLTAFDIKTYKTKKVLNKYKNKIELLWGDITNYNDVKNAVKGMDYIIHLAAIIPPLADTEKLLAKKVNIEGTKNVVKAIKENKKGFLLFSSSISVYGDRVKDFWITTKDKLKPSLGDYYAKTKIECEKIIKTGNIDYTIFRLTGVMGHPKIDPLLFHMPLDTKFEIATTRTVAYAFVEALYNEKKLNKKVFNLAGGENSRVIYKDFLKRSLDIYGLDSSKIPEIAFATQNFHCGYYKDTDKLNNILHFQKDTLEDYYNLLKEKTNPITLLFTKMFSGIIINKLIKKSEPLKALKNNEKELIKRFYFNEEEESFLEKTIIKGKELLEKINLLK